MSWANYLNNFGISDIIALAAFFGALYTYVAHERRLKRQQSKINSYTIKENEEKERIKKSANINCSVIKDLKSRSFLRVSNSGMADARNIKVTIDAETLESIYTRESMEYSLLTQYAKYDIPISVYHNVPTRSYVTVDWIDELGEQSKNFVVTL